MKNFKIVFFLLFGLLLSCKSVTSVVDAKDDPLDIYLLIGQSNMAGRATIEKQDQDSVPNVFLFTNNEKEPWEKAANPLNKYSTIRKELRMQKLGPGYSFAKSMIEARPNKKIGLIVNAKGGSSIDEWAPGTSFYTDAITIAQKASKYGVVKGVVWHQGETDAAKSDTYLPKLITLINSLRKDLNSPNLPFVAGQLSPDKPRRVIFNTMILGLPKVIANTGVVTSENTSTIDSTHFDSASQRVLGRRYAQEMLKFLD